jgi:hypothetical protein
LHLSCGNTELKKDVKKFLCISAVILMVKGASQGAEIKGDFAMFNDLVHSNDVVAFLGGADVAAASESGHLETLLAIAFQRQNLHFRNFGWEGSTVFQRRPADIGFPTQKAQLEKAGATLIFLQCGRAEALGRNYSVSAFRSEYEKLIAECLDVTPRIVLVTPPPLENGGAPLPDLSAHNKELAQFVTAIHDLAHEHHFALIDLFKELAQSSSAESRLTENGLQLSPRGQALVASAFVRELGFGPLAAKAGEVDHAGRWLNPAFERVRQQVVSKNKLWFNYWRPQNWAFLGGDRMTQPSSRDHKDPSVRWFPSEIEQFVPLIQQAEAGINESAKLLLK